LAENAADAVAPEFVIHRDSLSFLFHPIGYVRSPFPEKFGVPRQPGRVRGAKGHIDLIPPYNRIEAVRGLEGFSHLWILFVFHRSLGEGWRPTIRPPRLGGKRRLGVFATRAPFRPNPIGMSAVRLGRIEHRASTLRIQVSELDLVDGTPVLDLKPYLPLADAHPEAQGGYTEEIVPPSFEIGFGPEAERYLGTLAIDAAAELRELISAVVGEDPRPAYLTRGARRSEFGMRLAGRDVRWTIDGQTVVITRIEGPGEAG